MSAEEAEESAEAPGCGRRVMRARFVIAIGLLLAACGPVEDAPDDRDRAECLRIEDASALTLPEVEVGCSSRQQLTLINRCDDALRVTGFSLDGASAHMALVHAPAIPTEGLELPGGGSLTLVVRHAPLAEGPHTARLNLQVRGASADWTLKSAARPMRLVTDTFVNEDEDGLADLLVVIDNGPLLAPHLERVRANMESFALFVSSSQAYRRMAITTTGGSGGATRADLLGAAVFDPRTPSFPAEVKHLISELEVRPGREDPLQVALEVVQKAQPGGPFDGLLRKPARTAIVIVTAGAERSPHDAVFYWEWLSNLAGGGRLAPWRLGIHVVGAFSYWPESWQTGPPPSWCSERMDDGVLRYLVERSRGITDEICSPDWSKSLEWLGPYGSPPRLIFHLSTAPAFLREPLQVRIDGQDVPEIDERGATVWRYDHTRPAVSFEPMYMPEARQVLQVTYAPACPSPGAD